MAVNIDWSLAGPGAGSIVQNALAGYQAGQQAGRERRTRNALAAYAQDPSRVSDVIAENPEIGISLRNVDRQDAAARQQLEIQRQQQHAQAAQRWAAAGLEIPADPTDPANPNAPPTYNNRRAALQQLVANNAGGWDAETLQTLSAAVNNPNARFDDATMTGILRATGGDPNAGAYNLGRGERRFLPGRSTPIAEGLPPEPPRPLVVTTPPGGSSTIYGDLSQFGGNRQDLGTPGVAAPPTQDAPSRPTVAAPSGPAPSVSDARAALQHLPGFRFTGGARTPQRNAEVGGSPTSYHLTTNGGHAMDFAADPSVSREQIAEVLSAQGFQIAELFYEGRRGNQGPHWHVSWRGGAPQGPAPAQQTANGPRRNSDGSTTIQGPPGDQYVDLPGGGQRNTRTNRTENVPAPVRQGRPIVPGSQEAQQYPGAVALDEHNLPVYPGRGSRNNPSGATLNLLNTEADAVRTTTQIDQQLANVERQIASGALHIGPVSNTVSGVRNAIGMSDQNSRNFASFRATLERMRNDSLRLNRGVQTEGDAIRAWNELFANINDQGVVLQRLREIRGYNQNALQFHRDQYDQIRDDAGLAPSDPLGRRGAPPARSAPTQRPAQRTAPAGRPAASGPAPPRVGEVRAGYRFNGGDPANPRSWSRAR